MRLILGLFLLAAVPAMAGTAVPDMNFSLPAPNTQAHRAYLGLGQENRFTLAQVKADILIVEIFSMYCPICQREAQKVNQLYDRIQSGQFLEKTGRTVRLVGIGAGNSDYEVEFFKETYGIEFPLFSDGDFAIHKKVNEKGTPYFIGIRPGQAGSARVFFTHSGEIKDLDRFLSRLIKAAD